MNNTRPHKPYQNVREDECLICLEILEGEIAEVSCGHIFHYECLKNWIKNKGIHRSCCLCDKNTEIVNIINFKNNNNNINKNNNDNINKNNKNNNNINKNNIFGCCQIL